MRVAGSVALRRVSARSTVGPYGLDQSTGTLRMPHSAVASAAHGVQLTLDSRWSRSPAGAASAAEPESTRAATAPAMVRSLVMVLTRSFRRT
jgi:hypothetical protein